MRSFRRCLYSLRFGQASQFGLIEFVNRFPRNISIFGEPHFQGLVVMLVRRLSKLLRRYAEKRQDFTVQARIFARREILRAVSSLCALALSVIRAAPTMPPMPRFDGRRGGCRVKSIELFSFLF